MKKHLLYIGFACCTMLAAVSCSQEEIVNTIDNGDLKEIIIEPYIGEIQTRAESGMDYDKDSNNKNVDKGYNGRYQFETGDKFVATRIEKTDKPVSGFRYWDRPFKNTAGWIHDDWTIKGWSDKIYWTDATPHTFIGYSVPQREKENDETTEPTAFVFGPESGKSDSESGNVPYYGTLSTDQSTKNKFAGEDLLLTHSKKIEAEGGISAKLQMHHAFAKVKLVLNIKGFAYTNEATEDLTTKISDITLTNQPLDYVWDQMGYTVTEKSGANSDNKISAWVAEEQGTANDKKFIGYALVVPGERTLDVKMTLTYSDVRKPIDGGGYQTQTKTYVAKFGSESEKIKFYSGKRTTLNITLVHTNEGMIVKATYNEWVEVDLNDNTELQKKSVFLTENALNKTYKMGDAEGNTNIEKCDWLYTAGADDSNKIINDCYGNDGSKEKPYLIKYADELVAFKQEIANGHNFAGKYVKLFTDIYLQPTNTVYNLDWPGIGTDENGKSFAGTFDGNYSAIQSLVGAPLFKNLASTAIIKHLTVQTVDARKKVEDAKAYATIGAILCNTNEGTIMGCAVNGTVEGTDVAAGIAITNKGSIYACYHQGAVIATGESGTAAGLVCENGENGFIKACYQAGAITGAKKSGVVATNNNTTQADAIAYCYYDTFLAKGIYAIGETTNDTTNDVTGKNIDEIKVKGFDQKLNLAIEKINQGFSESDATKKIDVHYIQNPGEYPTLEPGEKATTNP